MNYRITIEREKDNSPDLKGYQCWEEVYQQIVYDVAVPELVRIINRPQIPTVSSEMFKKVLAND